MTWTDERIALMRELYAQGLSFSFIAAMIGGVSRNAVIGKAHRLGIKGRGQPRLQMPRSIPNNTGRRYRKKPPVELPPEVLTDPVDFFNLCPHHCRWPVSGEGLAMLYCGAQKHGQFSYCLGHCRMAWQTPAQRTKKRWSEMWNAPFPYPGAFVKSRRLINAACPAAGARPSRRLSASRGNL